MTDQLIPREPRRKKQPTADVLREQLRLAADEIIRLQRELDGARTDLAYAKELLGRPAWRRIFPTTTRWPSERGKPPYRNPTAPPAEFDGTGGRGYQPLPDAVQTTPPGAD